MASGMTALIFLQLAMVVALGVAGDQPPCASDQLCDAPQEQGSSLLQRRSESGITAVAFDSSATLRSEKVDRLKAALAAQQKVARDDQIERLLDFEDERKDAESRTGTMEGAHAIESGCSDTPGWQNWFGYDCNLYGKNFCENGGGRPGMDWAFGMWLGSPEDNCCVCGKDQEATCSTHSCPYGWHSKPEQASSSTLTHENCCQITCAGFIFENGCPSGYEPDWDKAKLTDVSDAECCRGTTTTTTPNPFEGPGKARYVRFLPQMWGGSIAMRAAVLEGDDLEVVDPPEDKRTYSSVKPLNNAYKQEGSDGHPGSNYGRSMAEQCCGHAWSPKQSRVGEWMQIDLERNRDVRGVVVIGKPKRGCPHKQPNFVKMIKIETATDEDPTDFEPRDNGKVFNTIASADKNPVRIVFGESATTGAPPAVAPVLIKADHECLSGDKNLGNVPTLEACAAKVEEHGGKFFIYGKGSKLGKCWMEHTSSSSCSEGWEADSYDFYSIDGESAPSTPPAGTTSAPGTQPPTAAPPPMKATEVGDICPEQRKVEMSDAQAMLKAHNYLRCLHGHPELEWDDAVASNAEHPAQQSCDAGALSHSDSYDMTPRAGENLAFGLSSPERAAAAWYNELVDPGYDAGLWGTEAIEREVGHYTALIWKDAKKLGCASCASEAAGGKTVWACQYAEEAPNSGHQSDWEANVPQSDTLEETAESCCTKIYG